MKLPDRLDFTQSNLQDYVDCHYRFYLRYLLRTKWPALVVDDAIDFERRGQTGARFHRLVQQYLLKVPEKRLSDLAAADPDPNVAQWWDDFLAFVPPLLLGERFVETILSTSLHGRRLLAKYDLVLLKDNGQLLIFDWKTSRKQPRQAWLLDRVQTRLYRYILTQAAANLTSGKKTDPEKVTMQYWFAPHPGTSITLPYSQEEFTADGNYFTDLVDEIFTRPEGNFEKTSDLRECRYCVYRSHCDRGTEAGDLAGFEDFNLETEDFDQELDFEEIEEIEF